MDNKQEIKRAMLSDVKTQKWDLCCCSFNAQQQAIYTKKCREKIAKDRQEGSWLILMMPDIMSLTDESIANLKKIKNKNKFFLESSN